MNIISGYVGAPHITSQQLRNTYIPIFGEGVCILDIGSKMAVTVVSANEIEVADGQLIAEGCTAEIARGTTENLIIDNGEQGKQRIDLIVARYTRNSGTAVEDMQLVVIKGTPAASDPEAPAYNTGTIADGDSPVDFPLYQVNLDGISITSVDPLVDTVSVPGMMAEVQANLDAHVSRVADYYVFRYPSVSSATDTGAISAALQDILQRGLGNISFQCFIFRTGAWQLNGFGSIRNDDIRATFVQGSSGAIIVVSKTLTTNLNVIKTYS